MDAHPSIQLHAMIANHIAPLILDVQDKFVVEGAEQCPQQ